MANTIRIKRRVSGGAGAPTTLANAELAFNEVDDILYYGKGTGGVGGSATSIEAIGGKGHFVDLSSDQTIGGNKTFSNTISGSIDGNAGTATKLATARTISLSTDATGSASFDGSANATIAVTLANTGVTAGTYTKVTVDSKGRVTTGATASISDLAVPTGDVAFNAKKITGLADPVNDQDAATKIYVDNVAQGLDPKQSVKAASTANIATLSGAMTVDGISLVAGDRVLVKDQSTQSQNGIYVVQSGSWTRALDASTWDELVSAYVFTEQGSTQGDTGYYCNIDAGGTLGTTAVTWVQFSGAGQITAGNGLTKTGNTIDAVGTTNRITVSADAIDIASTYVGQTSITTLGTITSGTWNGTTIAVANGGTGATTAQGAINTLAGATTAGQYLRGNGTNVVMSAIQASDVPTLNQNTTGTASNVTGTVAIANGGTGATTASGARTNLGATTVGSNLFTLTNPSAVTFLRVNADNTVSALDAATFRTAIGAGTSSTTGTVTSVSGTGTVNGITLTGTVTASGSLTLGGTLSGVNLGTQVTGTLPVANGGTGATTLTGILKGNGTSAIGTATAGTDYLDPNSTIDGGTY